MNDIYVRMDGKDNVVNQEAELQNHAKDVRVKEGSQPKSIDNGDNAGEVSENTDAAAAIGEHKESTGNVDSSAVTASANHLRSTPSSDGSSSPRSTDSQLRATEEVKTELDSNAERLEERLKSNRIFQTYY